MKCVTQNTSYIIGQCSELTVSRHLLRHCFWPIVEHGNSVSCSCNSAGFPVGGSGEPFLNWPLKKTAHVHAACSTFANFNPSAMVAFSLISSLSSAVFTCEAVDNLILISASAISNNWDDTCILGWGIRHFFFSCSALDFGTRQMNSNVIGLRPVLYTFADGRQILIWCIRWWWQLLKFRFFFAERCISVWMKFILF